MRKEFFLTVKSETTCEDGSESFLGFPCFVASLVLSQSSAGKGQGGTKLKALGLKGFPGKVTSTR